MTNEPLESPRLIPNVIVRGMVRAARLRTRLHLPRGDLASARGVSPCTPARRCASCARRILGSSELSMRYALKAVQYLYLGRVARRSPCIEESGGRRKFGPQTTPQDTGVARSPHTPTTSTGTTPTVRIFTDTRRRSRTQLLPRRRGGTRGHLFSRSIDVHGGPKQGGAGAPASDLADGDARVRAKPALRKRPHALRPGTALGPLTMYPPSGL